MKICLHFRIIRRTSSEPHFPGFHFASSCTAPGRIPFCVSLLLSFIFPARLLAFFREAFNFNARRFSPAQMEFFIKLSRILFSKTMENKFFMKISSSKMSDQVMLFSFLLSISPQCCLTQRRL